MAGTFLPQSGHPNGSHGGRGIIFKRLLRSSDSSSDPLANTILLTVSWVEGLSQLLEVLFRSKRKGRAHQRCIMVACWPVTLQVARLVQMSYIVEMTLVTLPYDRTISNTC